MQLCVKEIRGSAVKGINNGAMERHKGGKEMLKLVVNNTVQDLAYQELRSVYESGAFVPVPCSIETLLDFDLVLIDGGIIKPSMEVTYEESQHVIMVTCFRDHEFTTGSEAELRVVS